MSADRRTGRGRLSSLDLVPEEGRDDVIWALGELNKRERTQADILFELNDRLAVHGIEPISRSAFSRASVRTAHAARRISEARAVFAGIADQFTPESIDENSIVLGEVIKTLILELLDDPDQTPKGAMELSRAFLATIQGQRMSSDRRQKLQAELAAKTAQAVDRVGQRQGLSAEMVDQIKAQILGVKS
ncbi:phage protein Gp27 family protein [Pannonibacter indicus]|uniref:phage protein Gp27 family protein n=1 Tax=Pannonibacter indicus TaxID=466044 RepID=UPI0039197B15